MLPKYLLALILSMLLMGCNNKCKVTCDISFNLKTVGYTMEEMDSVTILAFVPNSSFTSTPVKTYIYQTINNVNLSWSYSNADTIGDTLISIFSLPVGYDYMIEGPELQTTYKVTDIATGNGNNSELQYCDDDQNPCENPAYMTSYMINGKTDTTGSRYNTSVYLVK